MVLTVSFVISSAIGLFCHRHRRSCLRRLDASVGASGPHDFAVRIKPFSSKSLDALRPLHPAPASVTIAIRPSDWDGICLMYRCFYQFKKQNIFRKEAGHKIAWGVRSGKSPARLCRFRALGLGTAYRCREDAILPMRTRDLISARAQLRSSLEERYRVYRRAALKDEAIQVENALRGRHLNSEGAPMIDHHSAALIKSGRSINRGGSRESKIVFDQAFGPIGTWPELARLSLRKTILSRQTFRRNSSKT